MSEQEKKVRETFDKLLPNMSDQQIDKFLTFSEGMAVMVDQRNTAKEETARN